MREPAFPRSLDMSAPKSFAWCGPFFKEMLKSESVVLAVALPIPAEEPEINQVRFLWVTRGLDVIPPALTLQGLDTKRTDGLGLVHRFELPELAPLGGRILL